MLVIGNMYNKSNQLKQCNDVEHNPGPPVYPCITKVIKGTFHQGHQQFSADSAGKQCVPNAAAALLYAHIVNTMQWEPSDMDRILINGDYLYKCLTADFTIKPYLYVNQVPQYINLFNEHFKIKPHSSTIGTMQLHEDMPPNTYYKDVLGQIIQHDGCIIIISTYASAIIPYNNALYYFDSHSRNAQGCPCPEGTSILLKFDEIEELCKYIASCADLLSAIMFEVTFFKISIVSQKTFRLGAKRNMLLPVNPPAHIQPVILPQNMHQHTKSYKSHKVVMVHFNKGDTSFSLQTMDKQWLPCSIMALLYAYMYFPLQWEQKHMHQILLEGNRFYAQMKPLLGEQQLQVDNLNPYIHAFQNYFRMDMVFSTKCFLQLCNVQPDRKSVV
jgi:hypothetical protein